MRLDRLGRRILCSAKASALCMESWVGAAMHARLQCVADLGHSDKARAWHASDCSLAQPKLDVPIQIASVAPSTSAFDVTGPTTQFQSSYLDQIVGVHRDDAEPQRPLLPSNPSGQLQQRDSEGSLRQALTEQGEAGGRIDEDVHASIPMRRHVAGRILDRDEDIVDGQDKLLRDQHAVSMHRGVPPRLPRSP